MSYISEYGKAVRIIGPKKVVYVAAMPLEKKREACEVVEALYNIPAV